MSDVTDGSSLAEIAEAKRALGASGEVEMRTAAADIQMADTEAAVLDAAPGGDGGIDEAAPNNSHFELYTNLGQHVAGVGGVADLIKIGTERLDAAKGIDLAGVSKKMGGLVSANAQTADQWAMKKTPQALIDTESSNHGLGRAYRTGGNMLPGEGDFSATKKLQITATRTQALEKTSTLVKNRDLDAGTVYAAERGVQGHVGHIMRMDPGLGATMTAGSRPKDMVAGMTKDLAQGPKGPTVEEETVV